jgi:hypothetical protein
MTSSDPKPLETAETGFKNAQDVVSQNAQALTDDARKAADRGMHEFDSATANVPRPDLQPDRWRSNLSSGSMVPVGVGWMTLAICGGVGVWLWMRWQRERNRPINRLRRQARVTASQARQRALELREQMPALPYEAGRPALGMGTLLVPMTVLLVRWLRARQQEEIRLRELAASKTADMDWQGRLTQLREWWTPLRIELEKGTLPKR